MLSEVHALLMMLSQVHALLISHLKSQIPLVGKDRKKAELIKHLDEVLCDDDDEGFLDGS